MTSLLLLVAIAAADPSLGIGTPPLLASTTAPLAAPAAAAAPQVGSAIGSVVGWGAGIALYVFTRDQASEELDGSGRSTDPGFLLYLVALPVLSTGLGALVGAVIIGDLGGAVFGVPAAAAGALLAGLVGSLAVFIGLVAGFIVALAIEGPGGALGPAAVASLAVGGVAGGAVGLALIALVPPAAYRIGSDYGGGVFGFAE
ncbi:MAG: hypothetical protein Q8O67_31395 [Deltaproteobacteria bacterium]|nr:hypothetical protein [Deltaproteobacteria bacterium]